MGSFDIYGNRIKIILAIPPNHHQLPLQPVHGMGLIDIAEKITLSSDEDKEIVLDHFLP
jgi:hypothetical protein